MRLLPLLLLAACWRGLPPAPEVRFVYVRESHPPDTCPGLVRATLEFEKRFDLRKRGCDPKWPDDDYFFCRMIETEQAMAEMHNLMVQALSLCREDEWLR